MTSACIPHAMSARCPVSASFGVSVRPYSAVPLVALWPSPLYLVPALDRPPSGFSGSSSASRLYSRRRCVPFLGLVPSAPSDCCGRGPALSLSAAMPLGRSSASVLSPRAMPLLLTLSPLSALAWVVGGFLSPP